MTGCVLVCNETLVNKVPPYAMHIDVRGCRNTSPIGSKCIGTSPLLQAMFSWSEQIRTGTQFLPGYADVDFMLLSSN